MFWSPPLTSTSWYCFFRSEDFKVNFGETNSDHSEFPEDWWSWGCFHVYWPFGCSLHWHMLFIFNLLVLIFSYSIASLVIYTSHFSSISLLLRACLFLSLLVNLWYSALAGNPWQYSLGNRKNKWRFSFRLRKIPLISSWNSVGKKTWVHAEIPPFLRQSYHLCSVYAKTFHTVTFACPSPIVSCLYVLCTLTTSIFFKHYPLLYISTLWFALNNPECNKTTANLRTQNEEFHVEATGLTLSYH